MTSSAIQNYLKAIYQQQELLPTVTISALAETLGVSAASTTNMVKKLSAHGLVRHSPYRGVELSPRGEKMALEVVRHHRLVETFLVETLGVPWDSVHAEAEKIEHVISEDLEERIAQFLGEPGQDPHGDPIPSKAGVVAHSRLHRLTEVAAGQSSVVQRVSDQTPEHLRHFSRLGLMPRATVAVVRREPFDGPLHVRVNAGKEQILDETLARGIWVSTPVRGTGRRTRRAVKPPQRSNAV